jgi:hypothetical protein
VRPVTRYCSYAPFRCGTTESQRSLPRWGQTPKMAAATARAVGTIPPGRNAASILITESHMRYENFPLCSARYNREPWSPAGLVSSRFSKTQLRASTLGTQNQQSADPCCPKLAGAQYVPEPGKLAPDVLSVQWLTRLSSHPDGGSLFVHRRASPTCQLAVILPTIDHTFGTMDIDLPGARQGRRSETSLGVGSAISASPICPP